MNDTQKEINVDDTQERRICMANGRLTHCAQDSDFSFWPIIAGGILHLVYGVVLNFQSRSFGFSLKAESSRFDQLCDRKRVDG